MCALKFRALLPLRSQLLAQSLVSPHIQSARTKKFDHRKNCRKVVYPECSPKNIEKTQCMKNIKSGKREPKPKQHFESMWENPDCCVDSCPELEPRLDDYYYKPSDKRTRCYMQTWAECPELEMIEQTICCYEKFAFPEPEKRKRRKVAPKTASCDDDAKLMDNSGARNIRCVSVTMPGCPRARKPPKCLKATKKPSKCKKICCPYPSFSECKRDPWGRGRKVECNCLRPANMCDVYARMRLEESMKKPKK